MRGYASGKYAAEIETLVEQVIDDALQSAEEEWFAGLADQTDGSGKRFPNWTTSAKIRGATTLTTTLDLSHTVSTSIAAKTPTLARLLAF